MACNFLFRRRDNNIFTLLLKFLEVAYNRVGISSWISSISWIFELDFSNYDFFSRVFFWRDLLAGFPINFQFFFFCTTYFDIVLRCQDRGEQGLHIGKGNLV